MKVLALSFDNSLIQPGLGDSRERFLEYARRVEQLTVLVPHGIKDFNNHPAPNLTIKGLGGNRFLSAVKLLYWTIKIGLKDNLLIVAHDPIIGLFGLILKVVNPKTKLNINVFSLRATNHFWLSERPFLNRLLSLVQLVTIKFADSFRVDGSQAAKDLQSLGVSLNKIRVIPIVPAPSNIEKFKKFGNGSRFNSSVATILSVGSLIRQKNQPLLIEAIKLVRKKWPKIKLVIVGDGPEKTKLQKIIIDEKLEKNIALVGSLPYSQVVKVFSHADIFALSSNYEGFARVIMEAAFSHLPIVSTDVGGISDLLINNSSGLIVPIGDEKKLAEGILFYLKNPKVALQMADRAFKNVNKYCNYETNLNSLIKFWEDTYGKTSLYL